MCSLLKRLFGSALLLLAAVSFVSVSDAQRRHGPSPLDTLGEEASQSEGWEILKRFRSLGVSGDYRFNFELRVMPRRDKAFAYDGLLLGSMNRFGPIFRVDVAVEPASIGDASELQEPKVQRLLLQNGISPFAHEAESWVDDGMPEPVSSDRYFDPIAQSEFTLFDLLMPYQYWQKFYYEGRTKFRGRPTHVFWLYPPEEDAEMRSKVSGVRIFLDEEFYALIQAEIYGPDEELAKTATIVDFKKVDEQWILKQVDVRNEKTRDKTRFKVVDAALGLELPEDVFSPAALLYDVYGTDLMFASEGGGSIELPFQFDALESESAEPIERGSESSEDE